MLNIKDILWHFKIVYYITIYYSFVMPLSCEEQWTDQPVEAVMLFLRNQRNGREIILKKPHLLDF